MIMTIPTTFAISEDETRSTLSNSINSSYNIDLLEMWASNITRYTIALFCHHHLLVYFILLSGFFNVSANKVNQDIFMLLEHSFTQKAGGHVASKSRTLQNDWWNLRHCSYSQFWRMIWKQTMKDWPDHVVISVDLEQFPCPLSFLFLPLIFLKLKCSLCFSRTWSYCRDFAMCKD